MDAFLSKEAYFSLVSINTILTKPNRDGLLLGHKRGHRIFVEKIFSLEKDSYSSLETYISADKHFKGKLIGFFTFQINENKVKKILKPFAHGQLFLSIDSSQEKIIIKSYIIDYKKVFFLSPVSLTLPKL